MSEFSIAKKGEFGFSFVVLQLLHFFFFLLSHPLYFSYFIFFFPYFLKLLSFLSPLFITTFLLLFAFFSLFLSSDSSKMGFLATTYQVVFDSLRPRTLEEIDELPPNPMEELEAYKIVFETYTFGTEHNPYDDCEYNNVPEVEVKVDSEESFPGKVLDVEIDSEESFPGKILDVEVDSEENFPGKILDVEIECGENFPEEIPENPLSFSEELAGLEAKTEELEQDRIEIEKEMMKGLRKVTVESSISSRSESSPWSSPGSFSRESSLGSYGSMRKEKEWRRTLACKLFEERHSSEGTEGMDSLWETYEKSESKKLQKKKKKEKNNSKSKRGKKDEEDEEEEEEDDREGQLCCLQALKFSTGKMNLGMGRPNLVKMTKALKGFGWLGRNGSRKRLIL